MPQQLQQFPKFAKLGKQKQREKRLQARAGGTAHAHAKIDVAIATTHLVAAAGDHDDGGASAPGKLKHSLPECDPKHDSIFLFKL